MKLKEEASLSYYDIKKATSLIVDASPAGFGAILIQSSKDGNEMSKQERKHPLLTQVGV